MSYLIKTEGWDKQIPAQMAWWHWEIISGKLQLVFLLCPKIMPVLVDSMFLQDSSKLSDKFAYYNPLLFCNFL